MIDWNYPIQLSLESHIRQDFGLQTGNRALIESCRVVSGIKDLRAHQCIPVIMETLWTRLRETHALRVVENRQKG
jgi:hypothetical protein